jgi:2-haloacid dehalogenase
MSRNTGNGDGTPQNVIFDLGGVLIGWDPLQLYRTLLTSDEEIQRFFDEARIFEWNSELDAGGSFDAAVTELSAEFPHYAHLIEAWHLRWEETITGAIEGTVDILAELRDDADTSVYALTNWSAEKFPIAKSMFDFLGWFEGVVVSGEEGMTKPDFRIYQTLLDRYDVSPATAVFIDDSKHNVEAANALGMTGVQFYDPARLRADLKRVGLPLS